MEPLALPIEPLRPARPIAVTILGWVFIVFSTFTLIGSLFAFAAMLLMKTMAPEGSFPPHSAEFPPGFRMVSWMFEHYLALVLIQATGALFSIYAAVMFLKLRSWTRAYFETLNWLGLAWVVVFGAFFAAFWAGMTSTIPEAELSGDLPPAFLGAFGVVIALFGAIFNGVFPALLIWLLRSRFVRPAFSA